MKILQKVVLADSHGTKIVKIVVTAPDVAKKARAGQFVVVMVREEGERIPLTVVDVNGDRVTLIVQEAGLSTKLLSRLNKGDSLYAIVGPLGHPTEIKKYGKVILVAGGVGIAEIYPVARALKKAGNHVMIIAGSRSKGLLFMEDALKAVSDELLAVTDDGSYGRKGFTTDILKELLEKGKYDLVYAVGPIPMMRKVSGITAGFAIKTVVSLNSLMLDGTGMCGGCRAIVDGETKFACVDGPEFDAGRVNWDILEKRNRTYADKERHICRLHNL